jgi:hypothetical protein
MPTPSDRPDRMRWDTDPLCDECGPEPWTDADQRELASTTAAWWRAQTQHVSGIHRTQRGRARQRKKAKMKLWPAIAAALRQSDALAFGHQLHAAALRGRTQERTP